MDAQERTAIALWGIRFKTPENRAACADDVESQIREAELEATKITPEMIEAGAEVLKPHFPGLLPTEHKFLVSEVLKAALGVE